MATRVWGSSDLNSCIPLSLAEFHGEPAFWSLDAGKVLIQESWHKGWALDRVSCAE